jgi:hypothetical protein
MNGKQSELGKRGKSMITEEDIHSLSLPFRGSFEEFTEFVMHAADEVFRRAGQMLPILITHRTIDPVAIIVNMPTELFANPTMKERLGSEVLAPMATAGGRYFAILTETWNIKGDTPAFDYIQRRKAAGNPVEYYGDISYMDGVEENVLVWFACVEDESLASAVIIRDGDKATLSEWDVKSEGRVNSRWYKYLQKSWAELESDG